METGMRDRRRPIAAVAGALLLAGAGAGMMPSSARAQAGFDVVNATANAGAVYVVYFTGTFPNFDPGVIGSTFPLAHTRIDNSPASEAKASPADTGQAGGTVTSAYNTTPPPPPAPQTITEPQFANSKYPPGDSKPATFGSPAGPYGTATTGLTGASASASGINTTAATGGGSSSSGRTGRASAFNLAMSRWRAKYMTPSAASRYPATSADAAQPDGTDGDISASSVLIDPVKGLVATGDARVHHASLGMGAVSLYEVHTAVSIVNMVTPQVTVTTTVGEALVGGVPVSIGAQGVTVGAPIVGADAVQTASQALNGVLNQGGMTVSAIAPQVKNSGNEASVTATAISITEDQPGPPRQLIKYNLGNIYADNLAVPSAPAPVVDLAPPVDNSTTGTTLAPTQTTYVPGTPGTPAIPASPITGGATETPNAAPSTTPPKPAPPSSPTAAVTRAKPTWLLVAYLLWQALIIGAFASIWWWRSAARKLT
jgi:hypothetical protein